jgi:hypothetical protein
MTVAETTTAPSGPDLTQGIDADFLADGSMLTGHVGSDAVLLARAGTEFFAVGAACTHYGGPLAEGLLVVKRFAVPGTTPVSISGPVWRPGHRP